MSVHIKSPSGAADIGIHSVRVKPSTTTKTVTANGTYSASTDDVDGYSSVTVNVPDNVPEQKLTAAQGGWRPAGDTGYEYPERYDATSDPTTAPLRCCLPTYVYNVGGSSGQISCEGSGIMANIRDLSLDTSTGRLMVVQHGVTEWLPLPISLAGYATDTPLCVTFRKTDGTQTLSPTEIGTVTIS
jgi:hypothetical protein